MICYRLTRDDGLGLKVTGTSWEAALELAFLYGWTPAGTEAPVTSRWLKGRTQSGLPAWDSQDYFSQQDQRVGREDALALAIGVSRAMEDIEGQEARLGNGSEPVASGHLPSRASVLAEGLSRPKRDAMCRLVAFASAGGFTIDLA